MIDRSTTWQEHDPEHVVTWTPATPPRAVEGPLALDLFAGRLLVLQLAPGQVAVHEVDRRPRRVLLDGCHHLEIGHGPDAVTPEGSVVFLRPDVPLAWRWTVGCELHVDAGGGDFIDLPLRGACALSLADPCRFHERVLAGLGELQLATLTDVLDTLVRSRLEARLHDLVDRGRLDVLQASVRLEALTAEDLADDLAPQGLSCERLQVAIPAPREESVTVEATAPIGSYDDVL
jgi:hypothetical protein